MWRKLINKIKKDKETMFFMLWFIWMAIYYGVRMFYLTPWYDELYTYYYFISRGPVYAAIHWPLPNNHVGYSVLSGFLNYLNNSAIGLRGISYLCAMNNLVLLYIICKKSFKKGWALTAVFLYSGMNLVNQLAVQGRGYTLAVTCQLTAVLMLYYICLENKKEERKFNIIICYILFSLSLTLGLYAVPSSVYWVIPVCIFGGCFLLLKKEWKKIRNLMVSSVIAAGNTLILYGIIWLAIGSNLLSKDENSVFYGLKHVKIICLAPLQAAKTGIDYMLATPYIQSVERKGFLVNLFGWFRSLLDYYYSQSGKVLTIVILIGIVVLAVQGYKQYKEKDDHKLFLSLYIVTLMLFLPIFLIIQCVLPYYRVFSYMGIPVAMLLCVLIQRLFHKINLSEHISFAVSAGLAFVIAIVLLLSKGYNKEYGTTEYYARDAYENAELPGKENICVTDCYQEYILKYYWNIECESTVIEGADCILLHKEMLDAGFDGFRWEFYHTYETIPWDYIKENMILQYENQEYELYVINNLIQ